MERRQQRHDQLEEAADASGLPVRQRFEQTIKSGENTPVALANPVPVHFTYISAWASGDGVVHCRDDIYARDGVQELKISEL